MKLLVPLEGSVESEAILPWVEKFLDVPKTQAHILHMSPSLSSHGASEECRTYLDRIRKRLESWGERVSAEARVGDPVFEILRQSKNFNLIAMRTRCRKGVSRLVFGSVASEILEASKIPLFLTGPQASSNARPIANILVPLDGSDWSAQIIPDVHAVARLFEAKVTLLHAGKADASLFSKWVDMLECRLEVAPGDPAKRIQELTSKGDYDLVAMATHGRSGVQRLLLGSVAEKVLRTCPTPVLLRRPVAN